MSTPLTASAIVAVLRAEGCEVVEYRDWRTHSRNHKGPWGPVYGVEIHHTVTTGTDRSVALCYDGYSSLPGPLCHSVGAKDGRIFMVGHGRTNHAGLGDDDVLRAVRAEAPLPAANEANTDGNRHFYGIELVNRGDGKDPWPEEQVDAAARWAAALCRAHGWNERSVIGHKEWQPGKIDPRFDMAAFRARVRRLLATPPGGPTAPPAAAPAPSGGTYTVRAGDTLREIAERHGVDTDTLATTNRITRPDLIYPGQTLTIPEDDMPTAREIAEAVLTTDGIIEAPWGTPTNQHWQLSSVITHLTKTALRTEAKVDAQHATIRELAAALAAQDATVDVDALVARIEAAIESVTVQLQIADTTTPATS